MGGALGMGEWVAGLVRILLSAMLVAGIHEYAPRSWGGFAVLLAFVVLSFIVTFFHELGHAVAVWRQRGTVLAISVCGLTYAPLERRLSFEPLPRGGDLGGFVRLRPPGGGWTRRQHAIVLAAGPLADAAIALLALAAASALSAPAPAPALPPEARVAALMAHDQQDILATEPSSLPTAEVFDHIRASAPPTELAPFASMLMVVAFISSIGNLLPYRGSDGAGLLALWRGRNRFARSRETRR